MLFLWLPFSQLWAIIKGQPHSPNANNCFLFTIFIPKVIWSHVIRFGQYDQLTAL